VSIIKHILLLGLAPGGIVCMSW